MAGLKYCGPNTGALNLDYELLIKKKKVTKLIFLQFQR